MMRWPLTFFLCSVLFLTSCGFTPMYGTQQQTPLLGHVLIDTPKDAAGRHLARELNRHLNPQGHHASPSYRLQVGLSTTDVGVAVARDGTVSRYNIMFTSHYTLTRRSDGVRINEGELHHVSSFNNPTGQYFSNYVAQKDATKRGITELAELYRQRINLLLQP